ncbi:RHS repeat-associated core domain-containing protein [Streptomyces sp. NPDC047829]|uniref:RHS repeat-associated core domain-containing protein n=1 Tax=Streptomyces sp. NPDC047829 TaxID=3154609 RepID=UPI0034082101
MGRGPSGWERPAGSPGSDARVRCAPSRCGPALRAGWTAGAGALWAHPPAGLPRGTTTGAVPQPYRYAGAYADPTGLYKMGHRYYDPTLGRFTQPGPSGQEENPYLYAGGDPINNSDP